MNNYKESNIPWIGNVPFEWEVIKSKHLMKNKKEIVKDRVDEFDRIALTLSGVVKRGKEDANGLQPKDFSGYQILNENDFVFKMIDLENVNTSRVGLSPYTGIVSPAYLRFEPIKKEHSNFLYYYFRTLYDNEVYNKIGGDGVRSALNASDLGEILCPFPPIDIQEKIVGVLDNKICNINELIKIQESNILDLNLYRQSVITNKVFKSKILKDIIFIEDLYVNIPSSWSYNKIKFVTRNTTKRNTDETLKYIALENVESKTGNFIHTDNHYDTTEGIYCDKYTVLFGKLRPYLSKSYIVNNPISCSSEFAAFTFANLYEAKYFYYFTLSNPFVKAINMSTYGTKMPRANIDFINNTSMPIPPLEEQIEIANYLDDKCTKIDELIKIKKQKIEELNSYKKSLIYEYVTGKKEV